MGKFARGLALQQLGQGLSAAGSTFAQSLLAAKKDKEEQAYRGLNADLIKQQMAENERKAGAETQNAEAEARVAEIFQKVQTDPAYKEAFAKQLVEIGNKQGGDLGTQYQSQPLEETGETQQPVQQPTQQPTQQSFSKRALEALRKEYPAAFTSKSESVQTAVKGLREDVDKEEGRDYGKMIVELQNAGILSPEEKEALDDRKRQKDLEGKKDLARYTAGLKPKTDPSVKIAGDFDKKLRTDSEIKKHEKVLNAAADLKKMLNSNNPVSHEVMGTKMAKLSGEVGNLAIQEQTQYKGSQALWDKFTQTIQRAGKGTMTDENRKYALDLVHTMESTALQSHERRINQISKGHAAQNKISVDELAPIIDAYRYNTGEQEQPDTEEEDELDTLLFRK